MFGEAGLPGDVQAAKLCSCQCCHFSAFLKNPFNVAQAGGPQALAPRYSGPQALAPISWAAGASAQSAERGARGKTSVSRLPRLRRHRLKDRMTLRAALTAVALTVLGAQAQSE